MIDWKISTQELKKRRKVFYIPQDEMAHLFNIKRLSEKASPGFEPNILVPSFVDLPDYVVDFVFMDFSRNAFGIVILSPQFERVENGVSCPEIKLSLTGEFVRLQTQQKATP